MPINIRKMTILFSRFTRYSTNTDSGSHRPSASAGVTNRARVPQASSTNMHTLHSEDRENIVDRDMQHKR